MKWLLRLLKRAPSEKEIEAAAIAHCDYQTGGSLWKSPLTDREYRLEQMRAALIAARNVR